MTLSHRIDPFRRIPVFMRATAFIVGAVALAVFVPTAFAARPATNTHKPAAKPKPFFLGTAGNDTYTGTPGADRAHGKAGDDSLSGLGGSDRLWGNQGVDTLAGGDGPDFVWPGVGADLVDAGAGDDRVFAGDNDAAVDNVTCGDGDDRVVARWDDVVAADCEDVVRVGEQPDTSTTPTTTGSTTTTS
jgi:Ca2+-binding RTX toxin-like protein